ncbi:MAG: NAD-dependent epimerase/dehydratase family protein [Planctomycetes bacterium]|nr:NAD-dependent epimerase/dehydratase family protein [Planctomycetota bacterium]
MNILITGSSGEIGTNIGLALLDRGDAVLGLDIRPNSWTDRIETRIFDLTVTASEALPSSAFDVVLHLAAHAKVFELVEHPERAMENIRMLFPVLDFCRRSKTPIVFGSSREVYGDIHRHLTDEESADFVVAESPYSASKIAGEAMIYSFARCYGLPYLVFRFSNVYGRYDNDLQRLERVIPLFADRIARQQPIIVYGREKVLDFTYVDDCVTGVMAGIDALVESRVENQTINLASGTGHTLVELVNMIGQAVDRKAKVTYEDSRVGEVTRYVADISKARDLLGYTARRSLKEGIALAVAWQRSMGG